MIQAALQASSFLGKINWYTTLKIITLARSKSYSRALDGAKHIVQENSSSIGAGNRGEGWCHVTYLRRAPWIVHLPGEEDPPGAVQHQGPVVVRHLSRRAPALLLVPPRRRRARRRKPEEHHAGERRLGDAHLSLTHTHGVPFVVLRSVITNPIKSVPGSLIVLSTVLLILHSYSRPEAAETARHVCTALAWLEAACGVVARRSPAGLLYNL